MASNALIWNPLASWHPKERSRKDRLMVFYNSTKGNLGLRQWTPGGELGWGNFWAERAESGKGNVKVGTGMTALHYLDWIRVYGIVSHLDEATKQTTDYISLLSPVIQSLSVKTDYDRLSGTGDGEGNAWLYYLNDDPPTIHERDLNNANSQKLANHLKLLDDKEHSARTHLASAWLHKEKKRFVFFQVNGGHTRALEVKGDKVDAKHGTPMAATSFVVADTEVLVLYTIRNADGLLSRNSSIDAGVNWETEILNGAGNPSPETLSAAANANIKENAVVFSATGTSEYQVYSDTWEAILAKHKLKL
ncbi:hypothetical protein N0V84_009047 [Fusarium piperis]|uniref:Uncharacterized protein n=1 Tax=Fusarium piperis TaxID=1435070 RepID=A0A9W9BIV5_9HYPO|nr:hypothetical protein N0V84_009047 [Fusarium piperis]